MHISNVHTFLCSIMLYKELLKEQKCSFMVNSLAHLYLCYPQVRCIGLLAIYALLICDNKLNHKALLKQGSAHNFFLDCEFNLYSARMRLCPNKACINKFHSFQTFNMFKAYTKQFC